MTSGKIALGLAVLLGAAAFHVFGQSPSATARVTLAGTAIEIRYASPSVRGRQIFSDSGLVSKDPTYPAWRAGANAATLLRTAGALDVGGLTVPAGAYTLYVWVKDPNAWDLIVNRQAGQWGRSYDASRDLGRVRMTMLTPPVPLERLEYSLTDKGNGKGELRLAWEHRIATVPLAVLQAEDHSGGDSGERVAQ